MLSSPFLVEKLGVKVLPCLVTFGAKAQVKDRIVGFEDLGNSDGFTTKTLEWRLGQGGEWWVPAGFALDRSDEVHVQALSLSLWPTSPGPSMASQIRSPRGAQTTTMTLTGTDVSGSANDEL